MRYIARGEPLLTWLLASLTDAKHVAISGAPFEGEVPVLVTALRALLAGGSGLTVRGATEIPSFVALSAEYPSLVLLDASPARVGLRIAVERHDGQVVAFVGSGSRISIESQTEASGFILDSPDDVAQAARVLTDLRSQPRPVSKPVSELGDLLQVVLDDLGPSGSRKARRDHVTTGHADLDRLTGGGTAGDVWVINGSSGVGKSTFALGLARYAAIGSGKPTHWISTRESPECLAQIVLSAEARVPLHHLRRGGLDHTDLVRLARRTEEINRAPLSFVYREAQHLPDRLESMRQAASSPWLLVVDSLANETDLDALKTAKAYATETQTWVVIVATNKAGDNIAEVERAQADIADLVLRLERPDMQDRDSPRAGEADIIVSRSRTSPTSTMAVAFQGHYARFVDVAPD